MTIRFFWKVRVSRFSDESDYDVKTSGCAKEGQWSAEVVKRSQAGSSWVIIGGQDDEVELSAEDKKVKNSSTFDRES